MSNLENSNIAKVLSVAGFDGSGGAGITSDAKIFSKFGILGLSAITVMTAQNADSVRGIMPVSPDFFNSELKAIFDYFSVDAVKTGLISGEEQSLILSEYIKRYKVKIFVVDPVYISTSNRRLVMDSSSYPDFLMPLFRLASVITPNINEAELIAGGKIGCVNEMKIAAKKIKEKIASVKNIIIKGSHLSAGSNKDKIYTVLLNSEDIFFVNESKKINIGKEIHGTGCSFSAGLTSYLSMGLNIEDALVKTEILVSKFITDYNKISDNNKDKHIYTTGNV